MHKKLLLKISLYVVSIVVFFVIFNPIAFIKDFYSLIKENQKSENTYNPFANSGNTAPNATTDQFKDPVRAVSLETKEQYKNDPEGLLIFEYTWGLKTINENTKWNYKSTPFQAIIKSHNATTKKAVIEFYMPMDMPLYKIEKEVDMTVCTEENTYIYDGSGTRKGLYNILGRIEDNSTRFMSFCLDSSCTQFGKLCKFYL